MGIDWAERIENDIRTALPLSISPLIMEPLEDPASMNDQTLDISGSLKLTTCRWSGRVTNLALQKFQVFSIILRVLDVTCAQLLGAIFLKKSASGAKRTVITVLTTTF